MPSFQPGSSANYVCRASLKQTLTTTNPDAFRLAYVLRAEAAPKTVVSNCPFAVAGYRSFKPSYGLNSAGKMIKKAGQGPSQFSTIPKAGEPQTIKV